MQYTLNTAYIFRNVGEFRKRPYFVVVGEPSPFLHIYFCGVLCLGANYRSCLVGVLRTTSTGTSTRTFTVEM